MAVCGVLAGLASTITGCVGPRPFPARQPWGVAGEGEEPVFRARQVTTHLADELSPAVDPSGKMLLYVSNQAKNRDIWLRPLDGGFPVRLTRHSADDFDPAFSPDGKLIAFASNRLDAKGDIFVMKADGSDPRRLTDRRTCDRQPAWFPDGRHLAFTSSRKGGSEAVFVLDLSTRKVERLTRQPGFDPAPSPDGSFLLFTALVDKKGETRPCLWIHRLKDKAERPLPGCDRPQGFGCWANLAGADWMVFSRFHDDTNSDGRVDLKDRPGLWKVNFHGWSEEELRLGPEAPLTPATAADITPRVHGRMVYYASQTGRNLDIWAVPLGEAHPPAESCAKVTRRAEQASMTLERLFLLRSGTATLADGLERERCVLQEADLLLSSGRVSQATLAYARLSGTARQPEIRNRARLGYVAAKMERQLPLGVSPSRKVASRKVALRLLAKLQAITISENHRGLVRADILRRVGRFSEALDALKVLFRMKSEPGEQHLVARAWLLKGEIYQALGNEEEALKNCLQVVRLQGVDRPVKLKASQRILELVQQAGVDGLAVQGAVEQLEGIARRWPDLPVLSALARLTIGNLHRKAGRRELARRAYQRVEGHAGVEPEIISRAWLALSAMAEEDGDISQALDQANELLKRFPDHPGIRRKARRRMGRLARAYADDLTLRGETGMAIKVYRQLIVQEPNDVVAHRRLMALLAQHGRAQEAVAAASARLKARPGESLSHYLYGLSLTYLEPAAQLGQAREAIERALAMDSQLAFAHQTLGWIFEQQARLGNEQEGFHRAAEEYQAALSLLDVGVHPRVEADLLLNLGNVHYALGDYRRAGTFYKQREEKEIPFDLPARHLLFLEQFGRSAWLSDQLDDAVRCFSRALAVARELGETKRLPQLSLSLGAAYQLEKKFDLAADAFRKACDLYARLGLKRKLASCRRNLAYNLYLQGRKKEAGREFAQALKLLAAHGTDEGRESLGISVGLTDSASVAAFGFDREGELNFLYTYQGRIFRDSGDLVRARLALERKLKLLSKRSQPTGGADHLLDLAVATNHLAVVNTELGEMARAAELFKRAQSLARDIGSVRGVVVNSVNRLDLLLADGSWLRPAELVAELRSARAFLESQAAVDEVLRIQLLNALGVGLVLLADEAGWEDTGKPTNAAQRIERARERLDVALVIMAEAEGAFREAYQGSDRLGSRLGSRWLAISGWNLVGVLSRLGRENQAEKIHQKVSKRVEDLLLLDVAWRRPDLIADPATRAQALLDLPASVAGTDTGLAAIRDRERLLERLVAEAIDAKDEASAFEWAEKLLARRRLDASLPEDISGATEEDRSYLQGLVVRTESLKQSLDRLDPSQLSADSIAAVRDRAKGALEEFQRFRDRGGAPRDFLRRLFAPQVVSTKEVQACLEEGEGLVELVALPERLIVFVLTRDGLSVFPSPVEAQQLRREVAALWGADPARAAAARRQLSAWILGPGQGRLEKLSTVLAVTDSLGLPLGLLVWKEKALGQQFAVTHLYSASDLLQLRKRRNLNLKRVLWVGSDPPGETFRALKSAYGIVQRVDRPEAALEALGNPGLVVWGTELSYDPKRPLRSAVGPDRELGMLEGLSFGALASRPVKSGLWLLTGKGQPLPGPLAGAGLEVALLGAEVPTALVIPGATQSEGPTYRVMHRMLRHLVRYSPAEALSRALDEALREGVDWRELLGVALRGDPGMGEAARKRYASEALEGAVRSATDAYRAQQWSTALSAFLEVRTLAAYLGRSEVLPRVDQGIVQSAFQIDEFELAAEYQRQILNRTLAAGDQRSQAQAHQFLGVLESRCGRDPQAILELQQAATGFDALGQADEAAQAMATLALAHDRAAAYQAALDVAKTALEKFRSTGNQLQVLRMLRLIGTTYLKRLNLVATARDWFDQALALSRQIARDDVTAAVLLDLSRTQLAAGSYENALELAGDSAAIYQRLSDQRGRVEASLERAHALWYLGDYQQAFVAQRSALAYAEEARDVRLGIMARSLGGLIAMNLGDLVAAKQALNRALREARDSGLRDEEAVQLNNLGTVAREQGEIKQARLRFQEALQIDSKLKSVLGIAYDLRHLGIVERMMGELDQAEVHLERALKLSRSIPDRFNEVMVLLGLAGLDLSRGRLDSAQACAKEARDRSLRLGLREVAWRALRTLGEIARRQGELEQAHDQFREAIQLVEQMRASLKLEEFRAGFLDNKYHLYQDMIHLLLDLGRVEEAFWYSERSRARGFLDLLENRRVEVGAAADRELLFQLGRRKEKLARLAEEVRQAAGEQSQSAQAAYDRAHRAYQELVAELKGRRPDLTDFVEVQPVGPADIRSMLPAGVVLLAYYVTEETTVGWVVGRDRMVAKRLKLGRKELKQRVVALRRLIESFSPVDGELVNLYRELVGPFEEELKGVHQVGILPHDVLNYLPFSALKPDGQTTWSDRVRIFICPSASVLRVLIRRHQQRLGPTAGLLAVGNPGLGDPRLELPFAELEAQAVGLEQAGSEVYLAEKATEALVREKAGSREFVHLACHGTFNPRSPLFSALKLVPGSGEDGELTALEVFSLSFSARLVTLSACQTGLGKITSGDEIIGFNRAFLAAGAGSVLSSLWRVSDVATAMLMKRFYRYLKTNSALEALYQAQRVVRNYFPHPAYWSGLVLVGSWL